MSEASTTLTTKEKPMQSASLPIFTIGERASIESTWMFGKAAMASGFAYFAGLNAVIQWMAWGIVFHMASTIACVYFLSENKSASHIGRDVVSKGLALSAVAFVSHQPQLHIEIAGQSVGLATILAGYFLCGEWTGFLVDMNDLGMPFPKWVLPMLQKARDGISSADISSAIVSRYSSVSRQPDGSTKVIENRTTVTTTDAASNSQTDGKEGK